MSQGLRILIDGTMANGGGGHTYLANLVPLLPKSAPQHDFRVLVRSASLADQLPSSENVEVRRLPAAGWTERVRFNYAGGAVREAADFGADVYYSAGEMAPIGAPCPVVAAFRNPNVFTTRDQGWPLKQRVRLSILRRLAQLSARAASRILFVSEDSASWIGDRLDLPEDRRAVVHHGIDPARFAGTGTPPHARPYVLSVSSVYRYKNFVRLIEAWTRLAGELPEFPDLVIIGDVQDAVYAQRMAEARAAAGPLAERIHLLGEVPYEAIGDWYRGASMFAFPSTLETFGHPLLEAMAAGVPIVAGDIPVSREVAGDAAFYADPYDTDALASAMREIWSQPASREILRKRGEDRVREFTWERSARGLTMLAERVALENQPAPLPLPILSAALLSG